MRDYKEAMAEHYNKLDFLIKYISNYYSYMIAENKEPKPFEYACSNIDFFKPQYCEFLQLQQWNGNKYFSHYGGLGCNTLPNVLCYRNFCMANNVKYGFTEWNFNQEILNKKP